MIDRRLVLTDKEYVKRELSKKRFSTAIIDELEALLIEIRVHAGVYNELCIKRNDWRRSDTVSAEDKRQLRQEIAAIEKMQKERERRADELLSIIPNLPDRAAPFGDENVLLYESETYHRCAAANPAPHWIIAEKLGILDAVAARSVSGHGFALYKGKGAKLIRALINYGMTLHDDKYLEILPPNLASTAALQRTGHLPKFASEQYKCENDDLWLIPTAEVPLTAALANTVTPCGELPKRFMGYSLAFRREAGSGGTSTRGLQRLHEFHKVELLKIAEPSHVNEELFDLLEDCLKIIKALQLQYRVIDLSASEMGDKYSRCFDIEVYSPGMEKWFEVSSVGHFADYQARRAGIKYIDDKGRKKLVYTLNGSGIAAPRVWAAIIETYQLPNGTVKVPEVLVPFMGSEIIE